MKMSDFAAEKKAAPVKQEVSPQDPLVLIQNAETVDQVIEVLKTVFNTKNTINVRFAGALLELNSTNKNDRLGYDSNNQTLSIEIPPTPAFGNGAQVSVYLQESHACCGKAYIWGMSFNPAFPRALYFGLFKIIDIILIHRGYTYVGFCHLVDHLSVKIGLEANFKELTRFVNKRTKNNLAEMYKIL